MIYVLVIALSDSFEYQAMLWVYGHYKYFNSFSAGTVFIRQNKSDVYKRSSRRAGKHIFLTMAEKLNYEIF